jgi:hypothetical protein
MDRLAVSLLLLTACAAPTPAPIDITAPPKIVVAGDRVAPDGVPVEDVRHEVRPPAMAGRLKLLTARGSAWPGLGQARNRP